MGIIIRDADLRTDRECMMECLLRNRQRYEDDESFRQRFKWSFDLNPYGQGRAWLAVDEASGKVVGYTSAFPRLTFVNGESMIGWNCADFSIDQEYRTLGVAMKLRRAAKDCVDKGEFPFLFAHPNNKMVVVHEKVGHKPIGKMARYAALLRLDGKLQARFGDGLLANVLAAVANPLMHALSPVKVNLASIHCTVESEPRFGDEYDNLFEKVKRQHKVIGSRDSDYLRWRFTWHPLHTMKVFALHDEYGLKGYAVFYEHEGTAHISDLLVDGREQEMRLLLSALMVHLRQTGICTVSMKLHETNPFLAAAQELGFRYRDDATSTVIAYAKPRDAILLNGKNWFMTVGDRDI